MCGEYPSLYYKLQFAIRELQIRISICTGTAASLYESQHPHNQQKAT